MKKQQPSKGTKGKDRWFWIMVTVFVVILLGLVLHHRMQTSAQNKTFKETQSWLQGVMGKIVKEHPGANLVSDPYCRRPSAKFEYTERSCFVSELVTYPMSSEMVLDKASEIQSSIAPALKGMSVKDMGNDSLTNRVIGYSFTKNGLDCFISYYGLKNEDGTNYSPKLTKTMTGLLVSASCSGPAMTDYFPNRD